MMCVCVMVMLSYMSVVAVSSYAINGREKECIQTFISPVRAIWDERQML